MDIPTIPIGIVNDAPDFVAQYGALLGVVVGALLGGIVQYFMASKQQRHERDKEIAEHRREQYFEAIEVAMELRSSFRDLTYASSGRYEPKADDHSPEANEMRARDAQSAEAIQALMASIDRQALVGLKVSAIGNAEVRACMKTLEMVPVDFIMSIKVEEDGSARFIGEEANRAQIELDERIDELIAAIRTDLAIDRHYQERSRRLGRRRTSR